MASGPDEVRAHRPHLSHGFAMSPGLGQVCDTPDGRLCHLLETDLRNCDGRKALWLTSGGSGRRRGHGPVALPAAQHSPGDAHQLVGQRHGRHVGAAARLDTPDPATEPIVLGLSVAHHRTRTVDERRAQAFVAALGNPQQARLAPGGVLARHQAHPG